MERLSSPYNTAAFLKDLTAGIVVYLVALPLCLGIAFASGAELISGLLAGAIGGIVVGLISGSSSSVSGPAAGLTAVVFAQIQSLGSFETFLVAVFLAGVFQLILGISRLGFVAAFFPTSVIKGLLAAIGVILILKQIPHLLGHDKDPIGDDAFEQVDKENTFSELAELLSDVHPGAAVVGISCLMLLIFWDQFKSLKKAPVPSALIVVVLGIALHFVFQALGGDWAITSSHLVNVPVAQNWSELSKFTEYPDFSKIFEEPVWIAALTIAAVATLETLLNLEAVDKLDPTKRISPPNRELVAQGCGNMLSGLIGGIPLTSVVVRSSVNLNAGARSKVSTVFHGFLIVASVVFFPSALNTIPLACLAAILLHTGIKLASPQLFKRMWVAGWSQFLPFVITIVGIVMHDLLFGVAIGMGVSLLFILRQNLKTAPHVIHEKHLVGEVTRIEFGNQVSFLNRAALAKTFSDLPRNARVLLDARNTDYIDPDVMTLIEDFRTDDALARKLNVSLVGFKDRYRLPDQTDYVDYSSRDLQRSVSPEQVLEILKEGNRRFRTGRRLHRDLIRQVDATAEGQFPIAAILGCIDSRTPTEMVFDLGLGDVFTARVAGNVAKDKIMASLEYATAVAGAKLIVVMGHSRCGAVSAAVDLFRAQKKASEATPCQHLDVLIDEIQLSIDPRKIPRAGELHSDERLRLVDAVARANVERVVQGLEANSTTLRMRIESGDLKIVGAFYDVRTGHVQFADDQARLPKVPEVSERTSE